MVNKQQNKSNKILISNRNSGKLAQEMNEANENFGTGADATSVLFGDDVPVGGTVAPAEVIDVDAKPVDKVEDVVVNKTEATAAGKDAVPESKSVAAPDLGVDNVLDILGGSSADIPAVPTTGAKVAAEAPVVNEDRSQNNTPVVPNLGTESALDVLKDAVKVEPAPVAEASKASVAPKAVAPKPVVPKVAPKVKPKAKDKSAEVVGPKVVEPKVAPKAKETEPVVGKPKVDESVVDGDKGVAGGEVVSAPEILERDGEVGVASVSDLKQLGAHSLSSEKDLSEFGKSSSSLEFLYVIVNPAKSQGRVLNGESKPGYQTLGYAFKVLAPELDYPVAPYNPGCVHLTECTLKEWRKAKRGDILHLNVMSMMHLLSQKQFSGRVDGGSSVVTLSAKTSPSRVFPLPVLNLSGDKGSIKEVTYPAADWDEATKQWVCKPELEEQFGAIFRRRTVAQRDKAAASAMTRANVMSMPSAQISAGFAALLEKKDKLQNAGGGNNLGYAGKPVTRR